MKFLALLVALAAFDGCGQKPAPNPPIPPGPKPVDAGPSPPAPTPTPPEPPIPPSPPESVYTRACANAAKLACPVGKDAKCTSSLEHAVEERITTANADCAAGAATLDGLRKCGAFFRCK